MVFLLQKRSLQIKGGGGSWHYHDISVSLKTDREGVESAGFPT